MNKEINIKNLLWIIPLGIFIGMVLYAIIDNQSEKQLLNIIDTCLLYETEMDFSVLLLQNHCLKDALSEDVNEDFCFALQGTKPNNFKDGILDLYVWTSVKD
jgi:hypothetical protein